VPRKLISSGFLALILALPTFSATTPSSIRGKLAVTDDGRPALQTTDGKRVPVTGDDASLGVLKDKRLAGMDFEAVGEFNAEGVFVIRPIHTKAMFVHRDGKKLFVTYWCDVCSIRTYSPGICWCCQEETELDLRERYDP
jgi:hypothetical protein